MTENIYLSGRVDLFREKRNIGAYFSVTLLECVGHCQ